MKTVSEAAVIINGVPLTTAQSLTLRIAASNFLLDVQDPNFLGDDDSGRAITKGYHDCLAEILELMRGNHAPAN